MEQGDYAVAAQPALSDRIALAMQIGGWLICFCLLLTDFGPGSPWVPILIQSLPWAFAAWLSIGRNFTLLGGMVKPAAPVLIGIPMISGFALLEAPDFLMLDQLPVYVAAAGLMLVYTLIIARPLVRSDLAESGGDTRGPGASVFTVVLLGLAMGFALNIGLVINLNGLSQRHAPVIQVGVVEKRFTSSGRGPRPFLRISGPARRIEDQLGYGAFETDYDRWGRTQVGMKACVAIHTGLLGWRWYDFVDC
jgi:hypothetical protein